MHQQVGIVLQGVLHLKLMQLLSRNQVTRQSFKWNGIRWLHCFSCRHVFELVWFIVIADTGIFTWLAAVCHLQLLRWIARIFNISLKHFGIRLQISLRQYVC
jgi:hypothetical protein